MGDNAIEASNETLLRQASMTAHEYMNRAIDIIDGRFGDGYSATHSELVAAFMQTSALNLGAAIIARAIEGLSQTFSEMAIMEGNVEAIDRGARKIQKAIEQHGGVFDNDEKRNGA
jgi:pyridoxine 5'-phosphate synthase PdxJ